MAEAKDGWTDRRHEGSDISVKKVTLWAFALLALIGVILIVLRLYFTGLQGEDWLPRPKPSTGRVESGFPTPRLQQDESAQLKAILGRASQNLSGYGRTADKPGFAQIPIEEAAKIMLLQGFPTQSEAEFPIPTGDHEKGETSSEGSEP